MLDVAPNRRGRPSVKISVLHSNTSYTLVLSRVCTVVRYSVLEAMTRVYYGKTDNSIPSKYKMAKDIQTLPGIYDYVMELSCCAKSKQNRLTEFCWGNSGSLSYFLTHTQSNKFFHLVYRSQIWKDLKHL